MKIPNERIFGILTVCKQKMQGLLYDVDVRTVKSKTPGKAGGLKIGAAQSGLF